MKLAMVCTILMAASTFAAAATTTDDRESQPAPALLAASAPASAPNAALTLSAPAPLNMLPAPPVAIILKTVPKPHGFFDARNSLGLASMAASLSADALSTQKGLAYPGFHEMNPIARPFVQTRLGAAAYSAGSFALLAGGMYVAHKTRHHKLERIMPFAIAGWEGLLSYRNYRVIAANRR
ncbi:MAG: hypothetical protein LAO78_23145 [Acidobacteriia bacterium]|nr:hypothetical protein [Terriglobia bacterium]